MPVRFVSMLCSIIVLGMAGCAGPYIVSHYGGTANKVITTTCRGQYKVSETDGKLLVSPYAATELYHSACAEPQPGSTGVAYEYAAVQFLKESNRSQCRITGGERLELLHSEFSFTCPAAPPAATSKK
jgi:hypothetical protein